MCGYSIQNKLQEPLGVFTDEDYERLIHGIAAGLITTRNLDVSTYQKIARKLSEGMFNGFGKDLHDVHYGSEDFYMLNDLKKNIYVFSGAKTYQEVREVSSLLTKDKSITGFRDFTNKAKEVLTKYNEEYLHAEYNSAIAQSRSASQWMEFEKNKELYPSLTYHTVGDSHVRPTHAELNDISRPVGDSFWRYYLPPNGWNCRCTALQGDEPKTNLQGFKKPSDVPDIFMMNAGIDRIVFSPKHPYFDVAPKDKDFAKRNFDLPMS